MEENKILYMNPDQAKDVDPSLINSITLTTGSIIKVIDQGEAEVFQEEAVNPNQIICEKCGLPKDTTPEKTENVFRGKEVLKGPNGMPLLGDLLSGNNLTNNNTVNVPVAPIQPPKPIQPQVQKPIIPPPKGPLNPSVKPIFPPKPRIIPPKVPQPKVIVPPQPPKVLRPNKILLHPGMKYAPVAPVGHNVFRNRKVEKAEEEILCPDCSHEVLCPECSGEILCPDCQKKETVCGDCLKKEKELKIKESERKNKTKEEGKNKTKEYQGKNKLKETPKPYVRKEENKKDNKGKDVDFDNYKYHEINDKTAKNKKSKVVVKKEGIIIASHDE